MPLQAQAQFAYIARALAAHATLKDTLHAIVTIAAASIQGAQESAITVKHGHHGYQTVASTGDLPVHVDEIQYQTGEGPCLNALELHHAVRSDDLSTDDRWPTFGPVAAEATGVMSMMSHRLYLEEGESLGALNLYSREPAAFAPPELSVLEILAAHCSIALDRAAASEKSRHLEVALASNRDIGVAIGILMTTRRVTQQQAFDLLKVASQHGHRKLNAVASDVIYTGDLSQPPRISARPDVQGTDLRSSVQ
jgi:GAF domain-containing protein